MISLRTSPDHVRERVLRRAQVALGDPNHVLARVASNGVIGILVRTASCSGRPVRLRSPNRSTVPRHLGHSTAIITRAIRSPVSGNPNRSRLTP